MAVALLALFVALGGTGYALSLPRNSVGKAQIKKNAVRSKHVKNGQIKRADLGKGSVTGAKVRDGSLTGADILESSLGVVPSATVAGTAQSAESAQSLNGVRAVPIRHRSGDVTGQTVLDAGGLQLLVTCVNGNEEVRAHTTVAGGEIAVVSDDPVAPDGSAVYLVHNGDDDFNPGDDFDLQDTPTAADDRIFQLHYLGGDGTDVTAHLITDDDLGTNNCVVSGYAVVFAG